MPNLPKLEINDRHFLNNRILTFPVLINESGSMCLGKDNLEEIILRCDSQPDLLQALKSFPLKLETQTYEQFYNCCMSWVRTNKDAAITKAEIKK